MAKEIEKANEEEEDSAVRLLREMGYKQELYRGFAPFMSFTFCFTAVNVLASLTIGFSLSLATGGSAIAIWSWFVSSIFTILVGFSFAEICSIYPSAGSVYHWAGELMTARYAPLTCFICGWFNFIGNVTSDVTLSSGFATILNAAMIISGNSSLSTGVQTGISIAISFIWVTTNALRIDRQGWIHTLATVIQIGGVAIIVIVLFAMARQQATAEDVFTSTYNGTGFPFIYVCFIGVVPALFSFSGYDAGAHLAEETRDAGRATPKGIVGTCICSAVVGATYLLALLFSIPNVRSFVESNQHSGGELSLAIATYQLAVPSPGPLLLTILLLVNLYFAGMSSLTATSRISFAMARDGVLPFSAILRWIFQPTKTPIATLIFLFIFESSFLLLQLVAPTAFSAFLASSTLGLQISYGIPVLLRCTVARNCFGLGEFSLGRFGQPIAVISSAWLFLTSFIMFFPFQYPVTSENMNYAVVIIGGTLLVAAVYWIVSARHWFLGPKRTNIDSTPLLPVQDLNKESYQGLPSSDSVRP
ncbi:unnamed protein product [Rotaria magnacalcarata]|uniref:Amino acid transporter n=5 Tax=Rotaria magnacalcarata TaxID=392030 RepID=A0A815N0Q3_9BILA|nr:unnamed protein product [Rotaria magnacalcarata]CAF1596908.1 unnamed protein product [Rotaria magnacalcarata]CAF2092755.1 unnamed protein product [Rotaria magnacalcarata]